MTLGVARRQGSLLDDTSEFCDKSLAQGIRSTVSCVRIPAVVVHSFRRSCATSEVMTTPVA